MPINFIVEPSIGVLNNSSHAAGDIVQACSTLIGKSSLDKEGGIYIDQSSLDSKFDFALVEHALNKARVNYKVQGGVAANHAVYDVLSNPFSSYSPQLGINAYPQLALHKMLNIWACVPTDPLPNNSPPSVLTLNILSRAGGPVSGVEFSMLNDYKGWDASSSSAATALLAGIVASLRLKLPRLNNFDIQALLRQTAGNWATGYDAGQYGYGDVNYDAALSSPSLFLQPPFVSVSLVQSPTLFIWLGAFGQTRRFFERLYLADPSYVWPVKDEYTQSDIDAAQLVHIVDTQESFSWSFEKYEVSAPIGEYHLVGFTTDGLGAYSRIESFCKVPVTIT